MNRLARWLILVTATSIPLVFTAVLILAASPSTSIQIPDPDRLQQERPISNRLAGQPEHQKKTASAVLEPALAKALAMAAPDQRLNIVVEMREQIAPGSIVPDGSTGQDARRSMVSVMQSTAERTQASIRAYLAVCELSGGVARVIPFWIFNGLGVNGARTDVVHELSARPDVALILLDHRRRWIEAQPTLSFMSPASPTEWGVARIRADEVWSSLGISGTGVVVASIDTGVDWQHPALQASYRGYNPKGFHQHEGNWYDATGDGALYPVDGNGHGSHTMGTMVGEGGIGVAPGAHWITVRGFDSKGFAYDSWLHASFEWLIAPNGDPDLAPRVVNNSWGSTASSLTTFQPDIDALRAAGIFLLFASGNAGPERGTVGSPASLPGAFAVGASDKDDEVASFSSRGPSPWGEKRPHVVAPGVNVYSSLPGGAYAEMQGTSMATPHVAGTAALMLSAEPSLSITQTAFVLTSTAIPLTDTVPNNAVGYGRVDAYAAVALAANAGLISGTIHGGGRALPDAAIRATPVVSGLEGTTTGDVDGHYQLFIGAGVYDLTASAFGYASAQAHAVPVITQSVTTRDFNLTPLPTGHLQGTVRAADGKIVEGTVRVIGTPVTTDAKDGSYHMDLPSGQYTLETRALGYRVVSATATISVGRTTIQDFVLPESMRILLVDSGPWYYQSHASFFSQALDDLSYTYDERRLKHVPNDTPTLTELLSYDLVVWSAPDDSPGLVGAGTVITDYLSNGGNLLLSGQDVAFWDGGGTWSTHSYYFDFLHSIFETDDAPSRQVMCLEDSAFSGISVTIEGGDGADNQSWPDEIEVFHPDYASLVCTYAGGQAAVVQAGFCSEHRALNLGFGFEAINSPADRAQFMAGALDWFVSPREVAGVELLGQTDPIQIAPPGSVVTHSFRLRNLGEAGAGDSIQIEIHGNEWQTTIMTTAIDLAPCVTTVVHVQVEIPAHVNWNASDTATIKALSSVDPTQYQTLEVTSKAPAPVLLVDDDRWFDQEESYEDALKSADLPYDRWEVTAPFGKGSPTAEVLAWYPVVLWFNGYDWFDPIHLSELDRLASFLDSGGRLFLSSQDALSYIGSSDFARNYLGVISYTEAFSQTVVQGVPEDMLGDGLGPVELAYPFTNWSDSVLPAPDTHIAFRGQHGQPGALAREGICSISPSTCRWRTATFAFPVEALPDQMRATLISRLVGWLSWLGGSSFRSNRSVALVGDTVGYTLTLRNDGPGTIVGATFSNTLPASTALVSGPDGGASYDPGNRRISWSGDLIPGAVATFTYQLNLMDGEAHDTIHNTTDIGLGDQGFRFQRQANVRVAAPDLAASSLGLSPSLTEMSILDVLKMTPTVPASTEVLVTLVVRNSGLEDANSVKVDNPLPWPLRLITTTLSSGGVGTATELPWENRILWEGAVAVGVPVTLTYRASAPPVLEEIWVYNAALLEDGLDGAWERGAWLHVEPYRWYFPNIYKDG